MSNGNGELRWHIIKNLGEKEFYLIYISRLGKRGDRDEIEDLCGLTEKRSREERLEDRFWKSNGQFIEQREGGKGKREIVFRKCS